MVKTDPLLLLSLLTWELTEMGPPCSSVPAGVNWIWGLADPSVQGVGQASCPSGTDRGCGRRSMNCVQPLFRACAGALWRGRQGGTGMKSI